MSLLQCNGRINTDFSKALSNIMLDIYKISDEAELSKQFLDSVNILRSQYQDEDFYEVVDKILNNLPNKQRRKKNPVLDRVLSY